MLIEIESQRSIASSSDSRERLELGAMMAEKGNSYNKPQKSWHLQCDFENMRVILQIYIACQLVIHHAIKGNKKERILGGPIHKMPLLVTLTFPYLRKANTYNAQEKHINPTIHAGHLRLEAQANKRNSKSTISY